MIDKQSLIPHKIEAEQAVLGSLIIDNDLIVSVTGILSAECFYNESHQRIYRAVIELFDKDDPVDELTIGANLKSKSELDETGGYQYLADLAESAPSAGNIVYYSKLIKEDSMLRELIRVSCDIGRKARDPEQGLSDLLIEAETKISDLSKVMSKKSTVNIKSAVRESMLKLDVRVDNKYETVGVPTGFYDLDKIISGLIAPNVITIAADSGVGKTTFALNIVENIYRRSEEKRATIIFSREMANFQLSDRIICSSGKVDATNYMNGKLSQRESDDVYKAASKISKSNILMNDSVVSIDQMIHEMKYQHRNVEGGLCLGVIDYLQLVECQGKSNREQEIAYVSRSIKRTAKDLDIPIIQLSQLNRDPRKRKNKRPIRSDLRESASIEHDTDILIFIYRDEFYDEESQDKGIAEINIDKHRNGGTGTIFLRFKGEYNRFENCSSNNYA